VLLLSYGAWAGVLSAWGEPVLGPIADAILFELAFVCFRVSTMVGGVVSDEAVAARVGPVVTELCVWARCAAPQVM
jgi:hypothetical protein